MVTFCDDDTTRYLSFFANGDLGRSARFCSSLSSSILDSSWVLVLLVSPSFMIHGNIWAATSSQVHPDREAPV